MKNTDIGFEKFEEDFIANPNTMYIKPDNKEMQNYNKCKEGLHPLKEILTVEGAFTDRVVRWCPECGAIVIDMDLDGRIYPGRHMPMKLPYMAKEILNGEKII